MSLSILHSILSFILTIYAEPHYPRKLVQEIVDFMNNFIKNVFLRELKNDIIGALKKNNYASIQEIEQYFNKYSDVFDAVSSEHKRIQLLQGKGYLDYEEFKIGQTFVEEVIDNETKLVPAFMYGIHVPLRKTLKCFLELPGLLTEILQYVDALSQETNIMSNIIQGRLWLRNYAKKVKNVIVLPLFLFYDELEVGNALGSHSGVNKFGAVYASIACLPPEIASRLNSILFSTLFYSEDKKKSTNKQVFRKLIDEINFLQNEGITVLVDNVEHKVKFQLVLILGDNLGLNGIFGFVESFKANFSCRICKMSSDLSLSSIEEDESLLRNRTNYESDVKKNKPEETGIKEECIFHKIQNFHVTQNLTVDMMHDILEGVCFYVMRSIITEFIYVKSYFSLEDLNDRIRNFDFGSTETSRPLEIAYNKIKSKINLRMSAAEMLCFVRYFGLLVGDMVPESDKCWQLYKYLRRIIDIVTSPRLIKYDIDALGDLIKKHNDLYLELFETLKPKFHNLLHYVRILLENGPCIKFWSMRYESRHQDLKSNALSSNNRKNLLVTIAKKQILQMCEMMNNFTCNKKYKFGSVDTDITETADYYTYFFNYTSCMTKQFYKQVEINEISYKVGSFIVTNMQDSEKEFGQIVKIMEIDNQIHFYTKIYNEVVFHDHYHAYNVTHNKKDFQVRLYNDLPLIAPCLSIVKNGVRYVATRYVL